MAVSKATQALENAKAKQAEMLAKMQPTRIGAKTQPIPEKKASAINAIASGSYVPYVPPVPYSQQIANLEKEIADYQSKIASYTPNTSDARYRNLGGLNATYGGDTRPFYAEQLLKAQKQLAEFKSLQGNFTGANQLSPEGLMKTSQTYSKGLLDAIGGKTIGGETYVPSQYASYSDMVDLGNNQGIYDFGDKIYTSLGQDITGKVRPTYGTGEDWWVDYAIKNLGLQAPKSSSGKYYIDPSLNVRESDFILPKAEMDLVPWAPAVYGGGFVMTPGGSNWEEYRKYGLDKTSLYSGDKLLGDIGFTGYNWEIPKGDELKKANDQGWGFPEWQNDNIIAWAKGDMGNWELSVPRSEVMNIPGGDAKGYMTMNPKKDIVRDELKGDNLDLSVYANKYFLTPEQAQKYITFDARDTGGGMFGSIAGLAGLAFGMPTLSMFGNLVSAAENRNPVGLATSLAGYGLNKYFPNEIQALGKDLSGLSGGMLSPSGAINTVTGAIGGGLQGGAQGALTGALTAGAKDLVSGWNPTGYDWLDRALESGAVNVGKAALTGGNIGSALAGTIGSTLGGAAGGNLGAQVGGRLASYLARPQGGMMPVQQAQRVSQPIPQQVAQQRIGQQQVVQTQMPSRIGARRIGT